MAKHLYLAYFAGISGNGMGLFCIGDGLIIGADIGGLLYDGVTEVKSDGSVEGLVKFTVPAGIQLISGMKSDRDRMLTVPIRLAADFDDGNAITSRLDQLTPGLRNYGSFRNGTGA